MNIVVINGSPKGDNSITLQTVLYLQKRFPRHSFTVIPAAARIRAYEKSMDDVLPVLGGAEMILFSYPVYTFMVPGQLHRFIELMKEQSAAGRLDLAGKYASQITTSKHFYDVTAHTFIEENGRDLGLRMLRGLSADMEDLTKPSGRRDAKAFFEHLLWQAGQGEAPAEAARDEKPVVVVADFTGDDGTLRGMTDTFRAALQPPSELVELQEFPFRGGCMGCLRCSSDGQCVYTDGFDGFLREKIQSGAGIVYAFTLKDHSMGSLFKTYDDRQFCNGHRTVTMGSPLGYLIRGRYSAENNLRLILRARASTGGNYFAGAVADEDGDIPPDELSASIAAMAAEVDYALRHSFAPPQDFYGVGGMRIFRDLIYEMRGFMRADHKFFKEHGQYDFPQKKKKNTLLMYLVGAMFSNPKLRKKIGPKMNEGMLAPYKKALEQDDT